MYKPLIRALEYVTSCRKKEVRHSGTECVFTYVSLQGRDLC